MNPSAVLRRGSASNGPIRPTVLRRLVPLLSLLAGMAWSVPAPAAPDLPVLDVAAVPSLSAEGRASYEGFLLMNLPRAFALSADGKSGWFASTKSIDEARTKALASCSDKGGTKCAIYAEDLRVVWPGRPATGPSPVPPALIDAGDHAFVPDARFIWHGPATARGLYVWSHGKGGGDQRGRQPQAHVRAFNNAGFDIVRFDREPAADFVDSAEKWLRQGLVALRQQGWKMIIAGGQSRGAWNSLQMLDTPGLADAVIAISPANFSYGTANSDNTAEMYRLTHAAAAPATRVAVAQFTGDTYVTDMNRRVRLVQESLQPRTGAVLVINQPEGIVGHGAGETMLFTQRYARCLLHFVIDPVPPASCDRPKDH